MYEVHFLLAGMLRKVNLEITVLDYDRIGGSDPIGKVLLGYNRKKLEKINNVEEIKSNLSEAIHLTQDEQIGIQNLLNTLENRLNRISSYSKEYEELSSRITSVKIELDDI